MPDKRIARTFNGVPVAQTAPANSNDSGPKTPDFDKAIFNQDAPKLKELIGELKLPKEQREDFLTAELRKACALVYHDAVNIEIIDALLDAGAKVNEGRGHDTSAFGVICQSGDVELVRHLIRRGADVNADVNDDRFGAAKPLHLACGRSQDAAVVAELLDNRADPNAKGFFEQTPLHLVAAAPPRTRDGAGKMPIVDLLLGHGAKVNAIDRSDQTPLFSLLTHQPDLKLAEKLIDSGASLKHVNRTDGSALHLAAEKGLYEFVDLLIKKGAPLLIKNTAGHTPLRHLKEQQESLKKNEGSLGAGFNKNIPAASAIDFAKAEALLRFAEDNIRKRDVRNFVKHKWSQWKGPRN